MYKNFNTVKVSICSIWTAEFRYAGFFTAVYPMTEQSSYTKNKKLLPWTKVQFLQREATFFGFTTIVTRTFNFALQLFRHLWHECTIERQKYAYRQQDRRTHKQHKFRHTSLKMKGILERKHKFLYHLTVEMLSEKVPLFIYLVLYKRYSNIVRGRVFCFLPHHSS